MKFLHIVKQNQLKVLLRILFFLIFIVTKLFAGDKPDEKLNDGTDPSRPVDRFDLVNDFYMDWQEFKDDRFYNITSLTGGKTLSGDKINFLVKIPFVTTNLTFETKSGLGDISLDGQMNFYLSPENSLVTGVKFIFPT